jgi:[ribosomal protein S18]-alanine N-acetyltransferase
MSDALRIGLARKRDIDAIHELEVSAFPAPWRREFFESELRASGRFNLAAKRGDRLIGYLFAMWFLDEMHINKIAVIESERRRGVARQLMDHCLKFATINRIRSISLEVRESNLGAQAFYESLAFKPAYVRPRYYPDGESAVVMLRELD